MAMTHPSSGRATLLARTLQADTLTPLGAFLRLQRAGVAPGFLLESLTGGEQVGRYSFLGTRPSGWIELREDGVWAGGWGEPGARVPGAAPVALARAARAWGVDGAPEGLPPFAGGAVGYVAWEAVRHFEPAAGVRPRPDGAPLARLMVFDAVVAFDHAYNRAVVVARAARGGAGAARERLEAIEAALRAQPPRQRWLGDPPGTGDVDEVAQAARAAFGREAYCEGVRWLKRQIRAGEILQGVLAERFETRLDASPLDVYRALRALNPSPYMFYVNFGNEALVGASPEMLVRAEGTRLTTRPIAGTRRRGRTPAEDARLERNLRASVKERAEHVMLVDLGRNDLGRVARGASVRVTQLMQVERYSHVMHLVSTVEARARRKGAGWRALAACFPAGTVSGAPKVRAMQLIASREPFARGPYAGAVVYADVRGNLDSAIAIRCLHARRLSDGSWHAAVTAGAGVVADSRPQREYDEVRHKARAVWAAVAWARAARHADSQRQGARSKES